MDDVLSLYIADADVPRDEDACRRLDRAFHAWSASFGHGGLACAALQKIAEPVALTLASRREPVATSDLRWARGSSKAVRSPIEACAGGPAATPTPVV